MSGAEAEIVALELIIEKLRREFFGKAVDGAVDAADPGVHQHRDPPQD